MPNNYQQNNQKPQIVNIMNAVVTTGEYFSQAENRTKKSYLTIGTLFIYDGGGMSLKLDALPANGANITFYPRKEKETQNQAQNPQQHQQQNQYQQ